MRMIFPKFPSCCWQQDHRDIVSTKMLHNVIRTWRYTHILYCIWRPWGYKVLLVKYEFDKTFYACLGRAESVFQNSRQFDHREHMGGNKQYCLKLLFNIKKLRRERYSTFSYFYLPLQPKNILTRA